MEKTPPDVPDAELRVLEALWQRRAATTREITDTLYPGGGISKRATVLKLLERLEGKRFVRRDQGPATQTFEVQVDRETLIGGQLRRIADRLGGRSFTPLLAHLVEAADLTPQERNHLGRLLKTEEPGQTGRPRNESV